MSSRWFNAVVVLFWLGAMSWLLVTKVFPPLLKGTPPGFGDVVAELDEREAVAVAWDIFVDDAPVGRAVTETRLVEDDVTEINSLVEFRAMPFDAISPVRFRPLLSLFTESEDADVSLKVETKFELVLDHLIGFESRLSVGGVKDVITMQGAVDGTQLALTLHAGQFVHTTNTYLSGNQLFGDILSPRAYMRDLRVGQSWTEPVYSPFRPPDRPLEVLEAWVERTEMIQHEGKVENTRLVVYRSDQGSGLEDAKTPRAKLWVDFSGRILRQRIRLANGTLEFRRASANRAAVLNEESPITEME